MASETTGERDGCGCAFVLDAAAGSSIATRLCGAPRRPGSAYCPEHHAQCHLAAGSGEERRQLREIEALATAVGGKRGRAARQPPGPLLRRLDRAARAASRPESSGMVRKRDATSTSRTGDDKPLRASDVAPTAERSRHGPIERVERAIGDSAGHPSRPYRAVDTLAVMARRGSITAGMRQAGEDFRTRFTLAQLDPLRALDLSHLRLGDAGSRPERDGPGLRIEAARRAVWRALQTVGGIASPGGSCLWHVVGWERSLKEWAIEQGWSGRRVSQEAASGILVAALGALEMHFGITRTSSQLRFNVDKSGSI
jgi:Domain of unknown function (DUF6456)